MESQPVNIGMDFGGGDSTSLVIAITDQGIVSGMHMDWFPLRFLGKPEIHRATDIRHDTDTDTWAIWLAVDRDFIEIQEAKGFTDYESARSMEVRWLNLCRLQGIEPSSEQGKKVMSILRLRLK